jgi:hypothetical protein
LRSFLLQIQNKTALTLGIISLATYGFQSLAWPLFLGRDALSYLYYYLDLGSNNPVYHYLMVRRTPVAPLLFGTSLSLGGVFLTEALLAVFYCGSILGIYTLGSRFDRKLGLALALLVNFYPAYGQRFHAIETESPSAFILIILSVLLFQALQSPKSWKFALLGLIVVLLTLARPDHVVFLALAAGPLILPAGAFKFKEKARFSLVFLLVAVPLLLLWSTYNYFRYDDFALSRGGDAHIPFQRAFEFAHTVRAENGPASADLVKVVETELLTKEPYKSYGIDTQIFFTQGTERMFYDLPGLSDLHYGWDSDYAQLKKAGLEAILAQPGPYLWSYVKSAGVMLLFNSTQPASGPETGKDIQPQFGANGLPIPTENDLIPRSYYLYTFSSPSAKSLPDPNSIELKILDPEMRARTQKIEDQLSLYRKMIPNRPGSEPVAQGLNFLTVLFPPAIFWLILGMAGFLLNLTREKLILAALCGLSLIVVLYPILGINPVPIMRTRFDPFFILFGLLGLQALIEKISPRRLDRTEDRKFDIDARLARINIKFPGFS